MIDISTASIKDLLGYAVRSEIDSNRAYNDLADRVSNPLLKEKFHWLAFEENKHKQILEKLFQAHFPGDTLKVPDAPSEELFK
jgi:rubrerythrin